ncbi:LytTR family DNA-binding domain-containing protein, partial [Xanthovirga aplysinae]|uniref:LytTR family DNA-binding domain-containing protein n=1 Tax=Xanthovirga aplysinae TaxID=2529853 RepID=UPI0012BC1DCE
AALYYGVGFNKLSKKWTIGKELLVYFLIILLISLSAKLTHYFSYNNVPITLYGIWSFLQKGISISILPFALIFFVKSQRKGKKEIKSYSNTNEYSPSITLNGNNRDERFSISLNELLYLKADSNYVEIHFKKDKNLRKHLIRNSLSKILRQNENSELMQVHRSYIVNLTQVKSTVGKSPNYFLAFKNSDVRIPVSRTFLKPLKEMLKKQST